MLDRLSMRELPCWKEWSPIFFSGVFHFFKSQSSTCCSHCDMRHVATVSNHIINKTKISKIAVPLGIGAAMAAEVAGACVLSGILDLVPHKSER